MKGVFRRLAAGCLTAAVALGAFERPVRAEEPALVLSAQSAVLMTADTGLPLYELDARAKRPMASTTKIMTALLALEEAQRAGDPVVEITEEMVRVEGSSMGLRPGDRLTLTNLAVGMLLASGNDAANAAALFLDGSLEAFAQRMNGRAAEIGMRDTQFVTPSGLDAEGHASTAMDLALLAREALKNPAFRDICASESRAAVFLEPAHTVWFQNHNKLLGQVEGCVGVKTGYTKQAGRCLVSAAERDGVTLIAVTLNDPDDWRDHEALLEYGFSQVKRVSLGGEGFAAALPLVGGAGETVPVRGGEGTAVTLPAEQASQVTRRVLLPRFLYAPVEAGETVGRLQYCLDGTPVVSVPLLAAEDRPQAEESPGFWERLFFSWEH